MASKKVDSNNPLSRKQRPGTPLYMMSGMQGWQLNTRAHVWSPPTDAYETSEKIIVRVEIAGMAEEDFSIDISGNVLHIAGIRNDNTSREAFHQMEIQFGEFNIDLEISIPVDIKNISAEYREGFLWVYLPKAKSKKIDIKKAED
ncbi:MAG: Hsp20/alpha crystallin family protein [Anaerolineaceae bacterium]|nr:Hsp20/alpha crystallin family protein [Anaerolineaceae bacterium]